MLVHLLQKLHFFKKNSVSLVNSGQMIYRTPGKYLLSGVWNLNKDMWFVRIRFSGTFPFVIQLELEGKYLHYKDKRETFDG